MPKRFIKRFMPHHSHIREHKHLKHVQQHLHDPNLWHLNRRSVSGAVGVGMFLAFVPLPFQMLLSAIAAIWLRINLPITVAMTWITNPITTPPILYFNYKVGSWVLRHQPKDVTFELTYEWLATTLDEVWQPFLLGTLIVGVVSAVLGYFLTRLLWRMFIVHQWRKRQRRRAGASA